MCEPADLNACNFPHGTCAEDGFCNCEVGYFGDYCMFPEICDDEPGRLIQVGFSQAKLDKFWLESNQLKTWSF